MSKDMDRPFLVGEKIYLRPFDVDDIEGDYIQWVNDSEIIGHLASNAFPKTKSELVDFVNDVLNNRLEYYGDGSDVDVVVADTRAWFGHIEFQNNLGGPINYSGGNVLVKNPTGANITFQIQNVRMPPTHR